MLWRIDEASRAPLYEQIASSVTAAVADGSLRPGDRLPSGRDLAEATGVTLETVQRAYRLLAERGVVVSRVGRGTSVRADLDPQRFRIDDEARALIDRAREAGLDLDDTVERLRALWG